MKFTLLLLISFFSIVSIAQPSLYWDRINDSLNTHNGATAKLITDNHGNVYLLSSNQQNYSYSALIKYDQTGNMLWIATDTVNIYSDIITDNQGSLYLCGQTIDINQNNHAVLSKYSTSGTNLWRQAVNFKSSFVSLTLLHNHIYAAGSDRRTPTNTMALLQGYDASGNLTLNTSLSIPNYPGEMDVSQIATDGDGLYLCGEYLYAPNFFIFAGYLSKYDENGIQAWSDLNDFSTQIFGFITADSDSSIYFSVQPYDGLSNLLGKFDKNGNLQWRDTILSCPTSPANIGRPVINSKHDIIIGGEANCGMCYVGQIDPIASAYLARLHSNGDTVFNYYAPHCGHVWSYAIQDDNHIIAIMSGRDTIMELCSFDSMGNNQWHLPLNFLNTNGWSVVIDSGKNILLGLTSSYNNPNNDTTAFFRKSFAEARKYGNTHIVNSIIEVSSNPEVIVYPNPAHNMIRIKSQSDDLSKITISDMTGKEVLSQECNGKEQSINVSEFPNGIYILHVNTVRTAAISIYKLVID